ncbi:MAG: cellulase family glycosylhydrolase, partial [Bacteroidota bacterium]
MRSLLLLPLFLLCCFPLLPGQSLLQADGTTIVNQEGEAVLLRGMGLGGWMLQEGYMLQTAGFANAQHKIRAKIEEVIGSEATDTFYENWLANHVRKIDIDSLAAWGFNSVRLPMHYNLFTLPIEEEPVPGENTWLTKGFELTDSLISWCRANEMYIILDLHAAPGGQGKDEGISDYDPTKPSLWESQANRDKTVALWKKLAETYKDEPLIAGYDLLNEPNWPLQNDNALLRELYEDITAAIRTVDSSHLLFIEGNWFANDFTGLTPPWDDNMAYSPHKYWSYNGPNDLQYVTTLRDNFGVPVYLGESGENSNVWFRDAIRLMEDNQVGWAWWPMKKIDAIAGPLSVPRSTGYQDLLDYWSGNGAQPSQGEALATLTQLTEDLKLERCDYHPDVIDAMFRQVYSEEAIPYETQPVPGIVRPENFDMGVVGSAYFDTEVANYQVSSGNYTSWNNGWVYRNDGVDLEACDDPMNPSGICVGWIGAGEWMQYDLEVQEDAVYEIRVRVASPNTSGQFHFSVGEAKVSETITVSSTGGWQSWQTVTVPDVMLTANDRKLRFYVDTEGFNLSSFEFIAGAASETVPTAFKAGQTLDDQTIEVFFNKPLSGPLPTSPANFSLFANGEALNITGVEFDPLVTRRVRFSLSDTLSFQMNLTAAYDGSDIQGSDETKLEAFENQPVENTLPVIHPIPGKIEMEDYSAQSGIVLETTSDVGGGENIGFLDEGDYLDYVVDVTEAGEYDLSFRTASQSEGGGIALQLKEGEEWVGIHAQVFPATGDWQSWQTTRAVVDLPAGQQQLRVVITDPLFNMNWMEFERDIVEPEPIPPVDPVVQAVG